MLVKQHEAMVPEQYQHAFETIVIPIVFPSIAIIWDIWKRSGLSSTICWTGIKCYFPFFKSMLVIAIIHDLKDKHVAYICLTLD